MANKIRVGVIFGGRSGEHEVSLMSARSVLNAIDREKYEVVPIGITREGRWLLTGDPIKALEAGVTAGGGVPVALVGDPTRRDLVRVEEPQQGANKRDIPQIDVVFPVLHGTFGEDGTIQGLFELANLPYVGAGVLGSAVGMDKAVAKALFEQRGLPIAAYHLVVRREWELEPQPIIDRLEERFGYPCFVKPANLGSSVGVSKARNREELVRALNLAARYDRRILVEEAVNAREIECSVLGNDDPIASIAGEIVPSREFYDYEAKYIDGDSVLIIPADISPEAAAEVRHLAVEAFTALDCAGMARVDFFLDRDTGRIYVNEVNTIPGFTKISMYPKLWEATGISYPELIDRLITLAIDRHRDKNRSTTHFDYREKE